MKKWVCVCVCVFVLEEPTKVTRMLNDHPRVLLQFSHSLATSATLLVHAALQQLQQHLLVLIGRRSLNSGPCRTFHIPKGQHHCPSHSRSTSRSEQPCKSKQWAGARCEPKVSNYITRRTCGIHSWKGHQPLGLLPCHPCDDLLITSSTERKVHAPELVVRCRVHTCILHASNHA